MSSNTSYSTVDFLIKVDKGEIDTPVCSGYPFPGSHTPTKYEIRVGKYWWSHCCPICGFGSAGGLLEVEFEKWESYLSSRPMMKKED